MPEEAPSLFGVMFECARHVLVRRGMAFKKVFICWGDLCSLYGWINR